LVEAKSMLLYIFCRHASLSLVLFGSLRSFHVACITLHYLCEKGALATDAAIFLLTTKHCFRKTKLKEILLWDYFVIIFLVMTEKDCPGTATFASLTRSDVEGVVAFFSLSKTKKLVKRKGENMNLDNGHLTDI